MSSTSTTSESRASRIDEEIRFTTESSRKMYTLKFKEGKTDLTIRVRTRGLAGSNSAAMKWKKIVSGQDAWRRTECTAAIDPRRYSESRVMATWTRAGSQDDAVSVP
nr:hypothetical protein EUGRSUZ_K03516 [Ipomoea batatas]GME17959.1 hypothetical protein EUGRSUZ_K03516 [Ipomoea batatas]GME20725.1 hypothetical protein EUGRSUZ_K03516 [Ipomoea batatas]